MVDTSRGRRHRADATWRRWTLAWLGGPANGAARDLAYGKRVGDLAAHQVSTASAIALFGIYFIWLDRRWPLPTAGAAYEVGGTWLVLTVLFEFGFGRYVAGREWAELVADYDFTKGRVWALIPLWVAIGPASARALRRAQPRVSDVVAPETRGRAVADEPASAEPDRWQAQAAGRDPAFG